MAAVSRYVAEDALELIAVDYESLPPVASAQAALAPAAPLLFEEHGHNVMLQKLFTWGDVDAAFAGAAHVVEQQFRWNRLGANPLETFGVVSQVGPRGRRAHLSRQLPGARPLRDGARAGLQPAAQQGALHRPPARRQLRRQGGARGTDITALLLRKTGGRPVKWIEDRMEYLAGGASQAWDRHYDAAIALDPNGKVLGFKVKLLDDLGATAEGWARSAPRSRSPTSPAATRFPRRSTTSRSSRPTSSREACTAAWARPRTTGCSSS